MKQANRNADVVIVGAGIAGLICGNHLASAGRDVLLLESSGEVGGRARTKHKEGVQFNFGPHAVYKDGALADELEALGIEVSGGVPSGPTYGLRPDDVVRLPDGPWGMLTTGMLGFSEKFSLMTTMRALAQKKGIGAGSQITTASEWLETYAATPAVRQVMGAFMRLATYTADLQYLPADIMVDSLNRALEGVTYLDGGWQTLVDGLLERFEHHGGRVQYETAATSIDCSQDGGSSAVNIRRGESVEAPYVVVAVGAARAGQLLDGRLQEVAGVPEEPEPIEAACLDLALSELPCPDRPIGLGLKTPTYVSDHSSYADLAPEGTEVLHAARYLDRDSDIGSEDARDEIEQALDVLQPGWRDHVVSSRYLSRMPVVSHMPKAGGDGGFASRPSTVVEDAPGLFLAGDWVGDRGWLSNASAASGARAAERILKEVTNRHSASKVRA